MLHYDMISYAAMASSIALQDANRNVRARVNEPDNPGVFVTKGCCSRVCITDIS